MIVALKYNAIEKHMENRNETTITIVSRNFSSLCITRQEWWSGYRLVRSGNISWPPLLMDRRLSVITRQTFVLFLSTFNCTSRESKLADPSGWCSYLERNAFPSFIGWQRQWCAYMKLQVFGSESNLPDGHRRSAIYCHALIRYETEFTTRDTSITFKKN